MHYWEWKCQGRNGSWYLDRFDRAPGASSGTWGDSINVPTRKLGERMARELNFAYQEGRKHGTYMLSGECEPGCQADRCRAMEG